MAKPPGRFTRRVEFWTTEAQADAINRLNDGGLLGKADHLRLMADWYLQTARRDHCAAPRNERPTSASSRIGARPCLSITTAF
jgi:hypothetical protein